MPTTTYLEALQVMSRVMESEGSFSPFMLYSYVLTADQEMSWKDIMIKEFGKWLQNLPRDEFLKIEKKTQKVYVKR